MELNYLDSLPAIKNYIQPGRMDRPVLTSGRAPDLFLAGNLLLREASPSPKQSPPPPTFFAPFPSPIVGSSLDYLF